MFLASIILIMSIALFLFYLQATCERALSTRLDRKYSQFIAEANRLEFPLVRKAMEGFDTPVDYPWVRRALRCDFLVLTYLLENALNSKRSFSSQERLLMLYFRAIFFCLFALSPLKVLEKPAILKLASILEHFADLIGQRLGPLGLGDLRALDDLLTP